MVGHVGAGVFGQDDALWAWWFAGDVPSVSGFDTAVLYLVRVSACSDGFDFAERVERPGIEGHGEGAAVGVKGGEDGSAAVMD
jgi:hypothetical protein